jgi:hypothetical protein
MVSVGDHEQDRGFEMISKQKDRRESRFSLPDLREVVFDVNIVRGELGQSGRSQSLPFGSRGVRRGGGGACFAFPSGMTRLR